MIGSIIAGINEPLLQLTCLDASLAIKPVIHYFTSVIITSGTLSPIDLYPKLLNFMPIIRESLPMTVFRHCLKPLIVTKGSVCVYIKCMYVYDMYMYTTVHKIQACILC